MTGPPVGFVGLGNMGSALASNLVAAGRVVIAYDALGPDRAPDGVADASNVAEVARRSEVVVLSLPDGPASEQVAREIGATADRRTTHVIDTSTVGPAAGAPRGRPVGPFRDFVHRCPGFGRRGGGSGPHADGHGRRAG